MRPARTQQSVFLAPLNRLLGTEAGVRVLRVLAQTREPLSRAETARRAELDASGVRRVLRQLGDDGIVEAVGAGAGAPVRLRDAHPLAGPLRALFAAERERVDELANAVREAVAGSAVPVTAAWIRFPGPEEDPAALPVIRVGVLAGVRELDRAARALRKALAEVERRFDAPIEVRGYTRADLRALDADGRRALAAAQPLLGAPAAAFLESGAATEKRRRPWRSHAELDQRSLALARAIGDRIARDPTLVERAKRYVARRMAESGGEDRAEMEEWAAVLETMPPPRLRAFLADPGERATRLRQSLPFVDVLTPGEREAVLAGLDA